MTPLVYVLEEQVRDLLSQTGDDVRLVDGVAFGFDDWTVFHAYTEKPVFYAFRVCLPLCRNAR